MRVLDQPLRAQLVESFSGPRFSRRRFGGPSLVDVLVGGVTAASQRNLLAGLAAVYDTIEIRTSVTPPAVIDLYAAAHDTSPPSPVTQFLKPTLVLSGRGGTEVLAPYGVAEGGWGPSIATLGVVIGIGAAIGWYLRGRRA